MRLEFMRCALRRYPTAIRSAREQRPNRYTSQCVPSHAAAKPERGAGTYPNAIRPVRLVPWNVMPGDWSRSAAYPSGCRGTVDAGALLCKVRVDGRPPRAGADRSDSRAARQGRGLSRLPLAAGRRLGADRRRSRPGCSRRGSVTATPSASSSTGPPSRASRGSLGVSEIVRNYVVHDDAAARRRTRRVVGQFLPSLLGGAIVTASFVHLSAALVPLLPGIWAICFGIGTFASRPYLPRASGYVALFYYAAGVVLLWIARGPGAARRLVGRRHVRPRPDARRAGVVLESRAPGAGAGHGRR